MVEVDLIAVVLGAVLGLAAGFTAGVYVMFSRVLEPVNDLLLVADKVLNKAQATMKGGGGLLGSLMQLGQMAGVVKPPG
jgi:hypothetical protein